MRACAAVRSARVFVTVALQATLYKRVAALYVVAAAMLRGMRAAAWRAFMLPPKRALPSSFSSVLPVMSPRHCQTYAMPL